jgi:hypothetical protein
LAITFKVEDTWSRRYMKSNWRNRRLKKSKIWRNWSLKKSKFEEVKDWRNWRFQEVGVWWSRRLKIWSFGESSRVCNSSRVSGATDMDMPFRYPRISIPGPAH